MESLKPVRGTQDVLPQESRIYRKVEETAYKVAQRYGFDEIDIPIFEFSEVFSRTLGDSSDIVTKEMYTFVDKGGDTITLRPEGTAGVARAFISNGLQQSLPLKLFYKGPMFRYERPQKGRRRQFRQVGVEVLGVSSYQADVEIISLASNFLKELNLENDITLELNTLGDNDSRQLYKVRLLDYLDKYKNELSKDSLNRLRKNPLRILDSKDPRDRSIVDNAPKIIDSLNHDSKQFFENLCDGLEKLNISFKHSTNLVRGLDYYCHTAFEFTSTNLGAQGTVLAGGRYDGLINQMGGPNTPGIGWAAGIERLALLTKMENKKIRPIAVIPTNQENYIDALVIAEKLRKNGFNIELGYNGSAKKRMKKANENNCIAAILLGKEEIKNNIVILKDMDSGAQQEISQLKLEKHLDMYKII
ncbi:MAG: histidine--tRNA ligase [Rhodospirillales bacterium]|nr:histidine--tRNA ligase [Rhodospirillales bacterium]